MLFETFKNLVLVLVTSAMVIKINKKDDIIIKIVLYIYYPLHFQKNTAKIKLLINII